MAIGLILILKVLLSKNTRDQIITWKIFMIITKPTLTSWSVKGTDYFDKIYMMNVSRAKTKDKITK